jgi:N-acetylglucosaminyl-diphospho-decaprenol L-rhamnosyltransferase
MDDVSDWTLVTVTYNSAKTLQAYWREFMPDRGATWLVIDNGSTDDSAAVAGTLGARVHKIGRNIGFARANNAGLAMCESKYIAFVNPDVAVDVATLSTLAHAIDAHDGLVGPQLLSPDGTPQANYRGMPFLVDKFAHRGMSLPGSSLGQYVPEVIDDRPMYVAWLMGAAVAARADLMRALGGWDGRYFLYYEDHELGLRAWQRRSSVVIVPSVRWIHGWARETIHFNRTAWRREAASATRFYAKYPELLIPARSLAKRRHPRLSAYTGVVAN